MKMRSYEFYLIGKKDNPKSSHYIFDSIDTYDMSLRREAKLAAHKLALESGQDTVVAHFQIVEKYEPR